MEDRRVEKINGLLSKAERAGTTEESEACFAKAQELMTKWAIDDAKLAARRYNTDLQEDVTRKKVILRSTYYEEDCQLLNSVARANQCRVLSTELKGPERGQKVSYVIGFPSDIRRVAMMFGSLLVQMASALERDIEPVVKYMDNNDKRRYRKSFRIGFADRIHDRLKQAKEESANEGDNLPALRDREADVEEWMRENMDIVHKRQRSRQLDSRAIRGGQRAADRADVGNNKVGGNRRALNGN